MGHDVAAGPRPELGAATGPDQHIRLSGLLAPAAARRFVRAQLSDVQDEDVDAAVLLTSEVVTNALLHAGSVMELAITRTDDHIMVTVADGKDTLPRLPRRALTTEELLETSRGMAVIVALATDFGWHLLPDRSGKVVWFTLALHGDHAQHAERSDRDASPAEGPRRHD